MKETSYEEDVKIDLFNLHYEWEKQSGLYMKWARKYASAVKERILVEEKLKLIRTENKRLLEEMRAEIDAEIRLDPGKYGFDKKPTETAIAGLVISHYKYKKVDAEGVEEVMKAVEEYAQAVEREEILKGATVAMSHRKVSLENEVQLFLSGYYSDPKIPKDLKDVVSKETSDSLRKELGRSPRMIQRRKTRIESEER